MSQSSLPNGLDLDVIEIIPAESQQSTTPSFDSLIGQDVIVIGDEGAEDDTKEQIYDYALNDKPFVCEVCNKTINGLLNLNVHRNTHFKESVQKQPNCQSHVNDRPLMPKQAMYSCNYCESKFRIVKDMRDHKKKMHPQWRPGIVKWVRKPATCPICNKTFTQKVSMNRHIRQIHEGEQQLECQGCHRGFRDKWNLNDHRCLEVYGKKGPLTNTKTNLRV